MRSWPITAIPKMDISSLPFLKLFDSASRDFVSVGNKDSASLYVCGITPYDATHMGHAATYIAFDLVHRYWAVSGLPVKFVQNITDIDDPLLVRASERHLDWQKLAEGEIDLFREDMSALRVLPPHHYMGAVETIPLVIDAIEKLIKLQLTYWIGPDLYFRYSKFERSHALAHLSDSEKIEIFGQRGGDPNRVGKEDPLDCLLWQGEKPGEPSWKSPWGMGRPGWHIECTAIAQEFLGSSIQIQGGGSDLIFPHHEMGSAQAECISGKEFARAYVHTGMIGLDGEKMSKSRGNLVFVSDLRRKHDPNAIRLALLMGHYRSNRDWSNDLLSQAENKLSFWRITLAHSLGTDSTSTIEKIVESLSNDLDTPAAIAHIDDWMNEQKGTGDVSGPGKITRAIDALLGLAL